MKEVKAVSICAFPPDGLLVAFGPADFMVVRNWNVTNIISDPVVGNRSKFFQAIPPFFDINNYPFVVSSGLVTYNLINVRTGKMQILIPGRAQNYFGQQGFCFSKQGNNWSMHFIAKTLNQMNEYEQNWYCLDFKEDLLEVFRKYGRLPYETITESLEDVQQSGLQKEESKIQQEENKLQQETISKLQAEILQLNLEKNELNGRLDRIEKVLGKYEPSK